MKLAFTLLFAAALAVVNAAEPPKRRMQAVTYNQTTSGLAPAYTAGYSNVWDGVQESEMPFFWYVGRSGGNTFARIVAECLKATQISAKGDTTDTLIPYNSPNPEKARVIQHQDDMGYYYNVNPNTKSSLLLLAEENVMAEGTADILISPRVSDAGFLFGNPNPNARMMVMLRHPVKREIDEFYWRQGAVWDPHFDVQLATMSIETFIQTNKLIDNFVVRSLNNDLPLSVPVRDEHVEIAKNVLREKFVVGIFEWYDASIERFEKYLGWYDKYNVGTDDAMSTCHESVIADGYHFGITPPIEPGTDVWSKIVIRTWADVELYTYAKHLFGEQGLLVQ